MPLITPDAHCPTFPQMGSLPDSLALHQWLKEVCSWNNSRRPLDALGATSGTEEYIVIILSGSTCGTQPRKPTGHKHKWQLLLLSSSNALARHGDHNASHKGKWARSGILGWAHMCYKHMGLLRDSALRRLQGSALAGLWIETMSEGSFLQCRAEKASQITQHVPEYSLQYPPSCFPVEFLPLHVSHPLAGQFRTWVQHQLPLHLYQQPSRHFSIH